MRTLLGIFITTIVFCSCSTVEVPATKLEKAKILPLELQDAFQFRKVKMYFYDPSTPLVTSSEPVVFERKRVEWGALDNFDRTQRYGNYFSFFWRTSQEADVTVRLEYRQAALGASVMAMERYYPAARGSVRSDFEVNGDDFSEFGRVTSWRALLIVDGRIVALTQSFMWR
jgi:hypothetical protein